MLTSQSVRLRCSLKYGLSDYHVHALIQCFMFCIILALLAFGMMFLYKSLNIVCAGDIHKFTYMSKTQVYSVSSFLAASLLNSALGSSTSAQMGLIGEEHAHLQEVVHIYLNTIRLQSLNKTAVSLTCKGPSHLSLSLAWPALTFCAEWHMQRLHTRQKPWCIHMYLLIVRKHGCSHHYVHIRILVHSLNVLASCSVNSASG